MSQRAGFTIIEVVVAIAIAAILIVTVASVTHSAAQAARRQQGVSGQQSMMSAAEKILRRDLAGWVVTKASTSSSAQGDPAEQSHFSFTTSSDSIITTETPVRHSQVSYVIRAAQGGWEWVRSEQQKGNANPCVLSLMHTAEAMRVEFYDGTRWTSAWTRSDRPEAIRLTSGNHTTVVRP